jgi:hypothetical protein
MNDKGDHMSSATTNDRGATRDGLGTALRTQIQLWLAIVFMALAFGAGLTIGVIAQHSESPAVGVSQTNQVPSNFGVAPPLTDQQIQQGLPSGHPVVGADQGSSGGPGTDTQGSGSKGSSGSQQSGSSSGTG